METGPDPGERRTDRFRQNRRTLWQIAVLSLVFLGLTVAAVLIGPTFGKGRFDWLGAFAAFVVFGGLLVLSAWMLSRPPVVLTIGPEGIHMPVGWRSPLAWSDIHRIRHLGSSGGIRGRRIWLAVDPAPGVIPDHRLPGPKRLERWYARRAGIRLPLHGLDAPPEAVIASLERFKPVQRAV